MYLFTTSSPHLVEIVLEVAVWESLCWREKAFGAYRSRLVGIVKSLCCREKESYRSRGRSKPVLERELLGNADGCTQRRVRSGKKEWDFQPHSDEVGKYQYVYHTYIMYTMHTRTHSAR